MSPTWIVDEPVLFVHPDGSRVPGRIAVQAPEVTPEGDDSVCVVALEGCTYVGKGIFGATPLQALLLGLRLIGHTLHDFRQRGGRVLFPDMDDGEDEHHDYDLEAIFGPLLCDPSPGDIETTSSE